MKRCITCVATGHYVSGLRRLTANVNGAVPVLGWENRLPPGSPAHERIPYAFKAFALKAAVEAGYTTLLWADACIVPIRDLETLFLEIEADGIWLSRNGWLNGQWCAESFYQYINISREENWRISHVVATAFGLDVTKANGKTFYEEYLRLSQTRAFCGPWWNTNSREYASMRGNPRAGVCGPPEVLGHRHDQSVASVLAWQLGVRLTDPPAWFSYRGGETESTVLVADGNY